MNQITLSEDLDINTNNLIELYAQNKWSAAEKPDVLLKALKKSHHLITAYHNTKLVGLRNAISDGYLVVYYPHLLVHPLYQGSGIGKMIMNKFQEKYAGFHQQMLMAESKAISFYEKCGFTKAGNTQSVWIYAGNDH